MIYIETRWSAPDSSVVGAADYPKISNADRSIQIFFEMDQSASSIAYLGQVMLVTICYMLTIEFTKCTNMGFDQSES